jgi:hypothetical protein
MAAAAPSPQNRSEAMDDVFRIELLPAQHGDCIWIEYGPRDAVRRILVDGGPVGAYGALRERVMRLDAGRRDFELLVVTHVDADHIEGALKLLGDAEAGARFGDVWFNGWPQIAKALPHAPPAAAPAAGERAPKHGEYLALRITRAGAAWNRWFRGRAIHVGAAPGPLPSLTLDGGMTITLLGPTSAQLAKLRTEWDRAAQRLGATPGDADAFGRQLDAAARYRGGGVPREPDADLGAVARALDDSAANGSSIAFLAEYGGRRCALLGDAHAPGTEQALRVAAHARGEQALRLDAVKLPHHGSAGNVTEALLTAMDCKYFLFSTNGAKHEHPDEAAVERVIRHAARTPHLVFNYAAPQTLPWIDPARQHERGYVASGPEGAAGTAVDLLADAVIRS